MPSSPTRRLLGLSLLGLLASACEPSGPASTTGAPVTTAATTAAPTAIVDAAPPPTVSAAPTAAPTATAEPTATAAPSAIADAGAPADAGAKPAKPTATAKPDAGPADAGPTAQPGDAGPTAADPAMKLAQEVDAIYIGKKAFTADFTQEYRQKISATTKTSTGKVFVERPNKISFRYTPPNENRIVSDGKTLRIYIASDAQMFETPVERTQYPGALAFLMGNGISKSFTFTLPATPKFPNGPVLLGKPLDPSPSYQDVFFFIDSALLAKSDPNTIARVLIVDAQGNRNRFDFTNAAQPAAIPPDEFVFTPPPGTNIVKQ